MRDEPDLLALERPALLRLDLLQADLDLDGQGRDRLGLGTGRGLASGARARLLGAEGISPTAPEGQEGDGHHRRPGAHADLHFSASPRTTASATARRTSRIALFSRVG